MKNLFYSICSSFRSFSRRLKLSYHVFRKDKDYDGSYLYQLLYIKFSNMVDYFETDGVADMQSDIDKIKYCRDICKHLMKCEEYPEHINTHNSSRFFHSKEEFEQWQKVFKINPIADVSIDIFKGFSYNKRNFALEDYYDIKARTLLFELMNNYIETWWD